MTMKETIRTEACSNNRRVYGVRGTVMCPPHAGGAQDIVRLGSRDRPNEWGEQGHALPRAESGELRDHMEGVRGGARVRGDSSVG